MPNKKPIKVKLSPLTKRQEEVHQIMIEFIASIVQCSMAPGGETYCRSLATAFLRNHYTPKDWPVDKQLLCETLFNGNLDD